MPLILKPLLVPDAHRGSLVYRPCWLVTPGGGGRVCFAVDGVNGLCRLLRVRSGLEECSVLDAEVFPEAPQLTQAEAVARVEEVVLRRYVRTKWLRGRWPADEWEVQLYFHPFVVTAGGRAYRRSVWDAHSGSFVVGLPQRRAGGMIRTLLSRLLNVAREREV